MFLQLPVHACECKKNQTTVNSIGARVLCERHEEKKMNHLILGAVFWVTGESGGTDGRLALPGTWPPAAGGNQRTALLVWMWDENEMRRARTHAAVHYTISTVP